MLTETAGGARPDALADEAAQRRQLDAGGTRRTDRPVAPTVTAIAYLLFLLLPVSALLLPGYAWWLDRQRGLRQHPAQRQSTVTTTEPAPESLLNSQRP